MSGYKGSTGRFDDPVNALTLECLIDAKIAKLDKAARELDEASAAVRRARRELAATTASK